ncbi:hypothetical protein D9M72_546170 [compost metagenome]
MTVAPVEVLAPILNHSHRCDRCGGRAYVVTVLHWSPKLRQGGELLWCRHHWNKHREALTPMIAVLVDETHQLTEHIRDDKGNR